MKIAAEIRSALVVNLQGLREARRAAAAVTLLFVINLAVAALAAVPIFQAIFYFTGHSLMSQVLNRSFSVEWLTDISINSPAFFDQYASLITLVGMVSIPLNTVLSGGVLGGFRDSVAFSFGRFFQDTGRYSWRLLRLSIIGLAGYWVVFSMLLQGLGGIRKWSLETPDARSVFWVYLARAILVIFGLAFVNVVIEYARVILVREETSVWQAIRISFRFLGASPRRALLAWAPLSVWSAVLAGFYILATPWREPGGWVFAASLLFVQQLLMFSRYWFRVATWAGEWACYSAECTDEKGQR